MISGERINGFPVAIGRISASGRSIIIQCPHCRRRHTHGAAGGDGHREAHCWQDEYRNVSGYWIRIVGRETDARR
jgi:hypothetical protein